MQAREIQAGMLLFCSILACRTPPTETDLPQAALPVCGTSWQLLDAPAPADTPIGTVAAVDLLSVDASALLTEAGVSIQATTRFLVGEQVGLAALELGPSPDLVLVDGQPATWNHTMVGDPARQIFVLDTAFDPCTEHELQVSYALPLNWKLGSQVRLEARDHGVFWSAGLEDAEAGNFLGMWVPSNLLFDRFDFDLAIDLQLSGAHQIVSTGAEQQGVYSWSNIQAHTPFWVVSPIAETQSARFVANPAAGPIKVEVYALADDTGANVDQAGARAVAALEQFSELFGPYGHGDRYLVWIRDAQSSSMEYDGATVTAMGAIEHEIMHSWYARGTSPLTDRDGWVDEAVTSWVTDLLPLRSHPVDFTDLVQLRHGNDGWDGPRLDITQYIFGSAIFADISDRYSVDEMVAALGAFYVEHQGASYTGAEFEEFLTCRFDDRVREAFYHQAYGLGPVPNVPADWCAL